MNWFLSAGRVSRVPSKLVRAESEPGAATRPSGSACRSSRWYEFTARLGLVLCALGSQHCTQAGATKISLVNWWQEKAEEKALNQLESKFLESRPTVTFGGNSKANVVSRSAVAQQLLNNAPPDSYQANIGADLLRWSKVKRLGVDVDLLEDVSPYVNVDASDHDDKPFLQPELREHLKRDGKVFGAPINIQRTNLIYYSTEKSAIIAPGSAPTKLDGTFPLDLFCTLEDMSDGAHPPVNYKPTDACVDDVDGQVITMSLLKEAWGIQNFVLEGLLPSIAGIQFYKDIIAGEAMNAPGKEVFVDAEPARFTPETREQLLQVLRCARAVRSHVRICKSSPWIETKKAVARGFAHFTAGGDWIGAELDDTAFVRPASFPEHGNDGSIFIYTSDVFPLPVNAPNAIFIQEFLKTVFDPNEQVLFSLKKGSVPAIDSARTSDIFGENMQRPLTFDAAGPERRALATSGLLPPKYPPEVAQMLETLLLNDDNVDDTNLNKAAFWIEIGFAEVKAWRKQLNLGG